MPNWSSNDLYVWGHQVMLDNFKRFINSMKEKTIKSKIVCSSFIGLSCINMPNGAGLVGWFLMAHGLQGCV